ncbi:DNA replication licensing factor MCM7 [Tanacetum coccineum]
MKRKSIETAKMDLEGLETVSSSKTNMKRKHIETSKIDLEGSKTGGHLQELEAAKSKNYALKWVVQMEREVVNDNQIVRKLLDVVKYVDKSKRDDFLRYGFRRLVDGLDIEGRKGVVKGGLKFEVEFVVNSKGGNSLIDVNYGDCEVYIRASSKVQPFTIREVRASNIGQLVKISGIVTRCSDVKPLMKVAVYTCEECGFEIYQIHISMHSIVNKPMVVGGEIMARHMMYVALTYDYRLIDGREVAFFARRIKDVVEDSRRLLLDI